MAEKQDHPEKITENGRKSFEKAQPYFRNGFIFDKSTVGKKAFETLHAALVKADTEADRGRGEATRLRADDTLPDGAFRRKLRENHQAAKGEVEYYMRDAEKLLDALTAETRREALPTLDRSREGFTREDARMVLDASNNPDQAMVELADRSGDMAALVSSQWGADYLRARGVANHERAHSTVVDRAVETNPGKARDAYREGLPLLRKAVDAVKLGTDHKVEEAGPGQVASGLVSTGGETHATAASPVTTGGDGQPAPTGGGE